MRDAGDHPHDEVTPRLSSRQTEILSMLMAGRSNKDIAYQLGIGLGTVKQHLVALFKKLHVTNRAMAISRGFAMNKLGEAMPASLAMAATIEGVMELRPANVLSLAIELPASAPPPPSDGTSLPGEAEDPAEAAWGVLRAACSQATATVDAALLRRPGIGVDIIFGLHKVYEDGAVRARQVGIEVARQVQAQIPQAKLRGGLASGELSASMQRMGGWTGETVAGPVIAVARRLREQATPKTLLIDANTRRLLTFARRAEYGESGGRVEEGPPVQALILSEPDVLPAITALPAVPRLVGRAAELRQLRAFLPKAERPLNGRSRGALLWIEGESGMGKTSLGHAFGVECLSSGFIWLGGRCAMPGRSLAEILVAGFPALAGAELTSGGEAVFAAGAVAALRAAADRQIVLMVDDIHLADAPTAALFAKLVPLTREQPLLLMGVGRGLRQPELKALTADGGLRLLHLSAAEIETVATTIGRGMLQPATVAEIVRIASGVPLFAAELARELVRAKLANAPSAGMPLTLEALVLSRLNNLPLDRVLLRLVAQAGASGQRVGRAELLEEWEDDEESFDRAFDAMARTGLLSIKGEGLAATVAFAHPLVGAVLQRVLLAGERATPEQAMARRVG